jgi:hypothetical protein
MNTLSKLLLTAAPVLLLTGCPYFSSIPGYSYWSAGGAATNKAIFEFHGKLDNALFPSGSHGDHQKGYVGYVVYTQGGFEKDQEMFYKALKLIFPEYEKHTQRLMDKKRPVELISFPPEECGAAILITHHPKTKSVISVRFTYQKGARGKCEKQSRRAESAYALQSVDIEKLLKENKFKGEPPLCSTIPKKHMAVTRPVTGSDYIEWYFYNQGFCWTDDAMLIHYFYQTPKQVQQEKAEKRRRELRDAENERQAEYRRHLRFDPMFDFTMIGPDGKKMRCGRPTPESAVRCR